jgi:VWFA-related protein
MPGRSLHAVPRRAFLLLAAPLPLLAQFTASVRVVNVFVSVRDKQGNLIGNLRREDFELFEDGRRQPVQYFAAQSDLPITLALLFDVSGSQRSVIPQQRETAAAFLRQLLRSDADRALLFGFNQRVSQTWNLEDLDVPRGPSGELLPQAQGTALLDAVGEAASLLGREQGRKAMVVLSDGIDTASYRNADSAIELAQRADVLIYPIRVYDRQVFAFDVLSTASDRLREGKKTLERMARETGGAMFEVTGAQSLAANFARLEQELRNQYSLGYTPSDTGRSYRRIRVTVKVKGLRVQARDGYYFRR